MPKIQISIKKPGDAKLLARLLKSLNFVSEVKEITEEEQFVEAEELIKELNDRDRIAMDNLNKAYSDDDPDYSEAVVKEPNPRYEAKGH